MCCTLTTEEVAYIDRTIADLKSENERLLAARDLYLEMIGFVKDENAKLRELCKRFAEYVSQDRCEGCVCKRRCNDGEIEECWQRTEIRSAAHELGVEVEA